MRWTALALIGALMGMSPATPGAAEIVCRPNALGTVSCPDDGPRPMARPGGPPVQGIDRVRARTPKPPGEEFIPARRTDHLGGIVRRKGGAAGPCREDTLGNLHCR